MINVVQPRIQAWVEEFLATELPQVARVCLDRTVPALVDAHVRSAIPLLLDKLLPVLVQCEVATALATVDEESPSGTAVKGAISSAVANRLGTTFPTGAGVDARAQRDSNAPDSTLTHAEPIGAAPGIGTMAPHPGVSPFTSHHFMVLQEGPQTMALPYSPIQLAPAGQKTAWGASRQKSDSRIGRAEEAHPALKDTLRRVQKTPPRQKTQDVATGRRTSTTMDALGDTAMTATDAIRDTAMKTARDATSDTAMPEGAGTPPMTMTPSRTNRVGATTGVAAHTTEVGSGEKTPIRRATVASAEKETATAGAETAGLPRGGIRNGCR